MDLGTESKTKVSKKFSRMSQPYFEQNSDIVYMLDNK